MTPMDTLPVPPAGSVDFLTTVEVAALLKVTPRTVHRWIAEGLPCHQPGGPYGRRLFVAEEVQDWVKSRCSRPTPGQSTDLDDVDGDAA